MANLSSPCMINKKYSKYFLKEFVKTTTTNKSGYPTYRRRDDEKFITKRSVSIHIDNRWIVPYNLYLN